MSEAIPATAPEAKVESATKDPCPDLKNRHFPLGAPYPWGPGPACFAKAVKARFSSAPETAVTYLDRIIDRQLNKARGLLSFNSILIAALNIERSAGHTTAHPCPTDIASIAALVSCMPLLVMMYVVWGPLTTYEDPGAEIDRAVKLCCKRAYMLTASLLASGVAIGAALLVMYYKVAG